MGATPRLDPRDLVGATEVVAVLGPGQPTTLALTLARLAASRLEAEALVVPITRIREEDRAAVQALARAGRNSHGVGRRPTHPPVPIQFNGLSAEWRRRPAKNQEEEVEEGRRRRRRRKKTPVFRPPVHHEFRNAARKCRRRIPAESPSSAGTRPPSCHSAIRYAAQTCRRMSSGQVSQPRLSRWLRRHRLRLTCGSGSVESSLWAALIQASTPGLRSGSEGQGVGGGGAVRDRANAGVC